MPEVLLCLNVGPELELDAIDWLLARDEVAGFTSTACYGHGAEHVLQSIAELVSGKARRVQIQIKLQAQLQESLLAALTTEFGGADVMYWVSPVNCSGTLKQTTT